MSSPFGAPPHVIAHRGGALLRENLGRENTLSAFRAAAELGVTHLETDVHVSADGLLYAIHDPVLDRVGDRSGAIAELTSAQIDAARVGGEPVPRMAELFATLPEARFTIDLKSPGSAGALARIIRAEDAGQRVCVGSFSLRRLLAFRLLTRGRVPTSAGSLGVAALRFLPWPLPRLLPQVAVAYQVPEHHRLGPVTVHVVTAEFVRRAHRRGAQVHVWTVDDPEAMTRLLDLGVDGIVTDRPDVALAVIANRSTS